MQTIARRVRQLEMQRQLRYNRVTKAVSGRLPVLLPELLKMLLASVLGFGIVAELLRRFAGANPLYVLTALGLLYSMQTAYYKIRLAIDPEFRIPRCSCSGAAADRTELVLRSGASTIFGTPIPALGVVLYAAVSALVMLDHRTAALALAAIGVLGSAYLGWVMVSRIMGLCPTCVSTAALNVLIFALLVV